MEGQVNRKKELNKGRYMDLVTANDNPQRQISKPKADR